MAMSHYFLVLRGVGQLLQTGPRRLNDSLINRGAVFRRREINGFRHELVDHSRDSVCEVEERRECVFGDGVRRFGIAFLDDGMNVGSSLIFVESLEVTACGDALGDGLRAGTDQKFLQFLRSEQNGLYLRTPMSQ